MDADATWIESLILAVECYPCLYNKADKKYCDRDLKAKAWAEVCETVIPEWEDLSNEDRRIKGKEIQQRWINLRHCFMRELREQRKSTSGQAAKKRRKYIYFEQLLFLLPTLEEGKTVRNLQSEEDGMADPTEITDSPWDVAKEAHASTPACVTTPKPSRRKRPSNHSSKQKLLNSLSHRLTEKNEEIDEDRLFLLSCLPAMRRMSWETKFEVKMEILKLMHRFELRDRPSQRQV